MAFSESVLVDCIFSPVSVVIETESVVLVLLSAMFKKKSPVGFLKGDLTSREAYGQAHVRLVMGVVAVLASVLDLDLCRDVA